MLACSDLREDAFQKAPRAFLEERRITVLKKTCVATGLVISAAAGALLLSSPAFAGGHDDDKNINKNALINKNTNTNDNDNSADADASIDISVLGGLLGGG